MAHTANTTLGLRRKTVLVVEDNVRVQGTLREIVEAAGFAVTTASSRSEAMSLVDHQAFDIAIVDKRLVELDTQNRDGLAVLGHINDKGEGTATILLTGYGEYADAVEAMNKLGVFAILEKQLDSAKLEQETLKAVRAGAAQIESCRSVSSSATMWSGAEDPVIWETRANSQLRPYGGLNVLVSVLYELARTCIPILERPGLCGLAKAGNSVLSGLYWSRGIGLAVAVIVCSGEPPQEVPRLPDWPQDLTIQGELYRVRRKNVSGLILGCSGVDIRDFPIRRSDTG